MKLEWRVAHNRACSELLAEVLVLLTNVGADSHGDLDDDLERCTRSASALGQLTAAGYPAFVRAFSYGRALLPVSESATYSVFSAKSTFVVDEYGEIAFRRAIERLLSLRPEVSAHLRVVSFGVAASTIALRQLVSMVTAESRTALLRCDLLCIGGVPDEGTLSFVQDELSGDERLRLSLRSFESVAEARAALGESSSGIFAHLAVVTGVGSDASEVSYQVVEWHHTMSPEENPLFTPRWTPRAERPGRMLLTPPRLTLLGAATAELMTAIESSDWSPPGISAVPEHSRGSTQLVQQLIDAHDAGLWVATIDRYASRSLVLTAVGKSIAILHQETRLSSVMPMGLIISQRSGAETDSAICRSLRNAGIVSEDRAPALAIRLRERASQIYGNLALKAATTGTGVNELVAHVVGYSILATSMSPWPVPPGCRVLLINLDQHGEWFQGSKRADLVALALDSENCATHLAVIEVKARRTDDALAASQAFDQLRQTLRLLDYVVAPDTTTVHSQLWMGRIYEAASDFVIDCGIRLTDSERACLEQFRTGSGPMDLGALALVFGPHQQQERHYSANVLGDKLPIIMASLPLSESVLDEAVSVAVTELRTVVEARPVLAGTRLKRRPERGRFPNVGSSEDIRSQDDEGDSSRGDTEQRPEPDLPDDAEGAITTEVAESRPPDGDSQPSAERQSPFCPVLGNDAATGEPILWKISGHDPLPNGHVEVWGASGGGKTQFIMAVLEQLQSAHSGTRYAVLDFKNDYTAAFAAKLRAEYFDLWRDGVPYNPLALLSDHPRDIDSAVIEIRDMMVEAAKAFATMGHRQQEKLTTSLRGAYSRRKIDGTWPTMADLDSLLSDELRAMIGDLTSNELFRSGPPLGEIINKNAVFALSAIPGNGLTTILAGGFILSALLLKCQSLPNVANTVRYAVVVDEAHRVSAFRAVSTMVREGRSKGLALILATQQPGDLPDVVDANAQTRVCFRLPDAMMAKAAARKMSPLDRSLPDRIRTLAVGEAFVSFGGKEPILVRMRQFWRDSTSDAEASSEANS